MASGDADDESARPVGAGAEPGRETTTPDTLRLLEEELSVDKDTVETGRVRVRVVTHEHDETVEVPLTARRVEVERVPVGREVDAIPPRRQEGDTTIVPVVEEVVVLSRKLVLKEEIRLKLVESTEQYRESVTLHRQDAVVERIPTEQASAPHGPT
jgi:uncharacterized protein (TIGR02271 family)